MTGSDREAEEDDRLIQQALDPQGSGLNLDFDRDLEPGEKADDAVDFGDLSDDDLADDDEDLEEIAPVGSETVVDSLLEDFVTPAAGSGISQAHGQQDFDELFGDSEIVHPSTTDGADVEAQQQLLSESHGRTTTKTVQPHLDDRPIIREQLLQQELFAQSHVGQLGADIVPDAPANNEELLKALWPRYQPASIPKFMELLPPKKAKYAGISQPKPPRPTHPSKITLELALDDAKSFKAHNSSREPLRSYNHEKDFNAGNSILDMGFCDIIGLSDSDPDSNSISELSLGDFGAMCDDWEVLSLDKEDGSDSLSHEIAWANSRSTQSRPSEYQNTAHRVKNTTLASRPIKPYRGGESERATAHISKRIRIDINDEKLLWRKLNATSDRHDSAMSHNMGMGNISISKRLAQRHNISNDGAYDLLKENHQHKVRGMLGSLQVEHSLPAIRLQWPFYKTRLEKQEARASHRPGLKINRHEQVTFSKISHVKKKHIRSKDTQTLFSSTKDLVLNDNSNLLLLEYSEEHPTMLSNFGMCNKIVNYYRKTSVEDNTRPKMELGELHVLLPQDKSPFSIFGHVDPGQVTPSLYNLMYRAPIFRQEVSPTDFLVVRSSTGVHGSSWYIRNIDHLHIVGQEFPSVDVPGPHSRKVTTASKSRLKMISFRLARRHPHHRISVSSVTEHFIDTTDMQNRQKLKEFMQFDKEHKEWRMKPGEQVPEEDVVRSMVKPEDVCLLESMQVGQQHLHDAGFSKDDDASDEDELKEGQSIEQQLAPWFTSRNFLNAAQGKAMLQLHGQGDPSGRGEGFSFIKTSMKGGFRAAGESIAERIDMKKMKDSGGHSYNVARQQQAYDESIRRIWEAQKQSLSSTIHHSDSDGDSVPEDQDVMDTYPLMKSPRVAGSTSGTGFGVRSRADDETATQSTRWSTNSQSGKVLEISRVIRDRFGNEEVSKTIVRNPRVIRQYLRKRRAKEAAQENLLDIRPGDDEDDNRRKQQRLEKELARLERNKDRRIARDKQRGIITDATTNDEGSAASPAAGTPKSTGTQRKCANCGQVGHIKTNKKLCPMLNGTAKPEDGFRNAAFSSGTLV